MSTPGHWRGLLVVARGANRVCVIDPADGMACLKYELPPAPRARRRWRRWLRYALSRRFPRAGINQLELRAWRRLHLRLGDDLAPRVASCRELVHTPAGWALRCDLVRTPAGDVAPSLFSVIAGGPAAITDHGGADALCAAVDELQAWLITRRVPLFDLNPGNFVVLPGACGPRLVCVDAKSTLSGREPIPLSYWSHRLMRRKIARRADRLRSRIRQAADPPPLAAPVAPF